MITITNEKKMSRYLIGEFSVLGAHVEQVESHTASPGIPDLDGMWDSKAFKIELKFQGETKPPSIRPTQKRWFRENLRAGGQPWALFLYSMPHDDSWILVSGKDFVSLRKQVPYEECMAVASWCWDNIDVAGLLKIVT